MTYTTPLRAVIYAEHPQAAESVLNRPQKKDEISTAVATRLPISAYVPLFDRFDLVEEDGAYYCRRDHGIDWLPYTAHEIDADIQDLKASIELIDYLELTPAVDQSVVIEDRRIACFLTEPIVLLDDSGDVIVIDFPAVDGTLGVYGEDSLIERFGWRGCCTIEKRAIGLAYDPEAEHIRFSIPPGSAVTIDDVFDKLNGFEKALKRPS